MQGASYGDVETNCPSPSLLIPVPLIALNKPHLIWSIFVVAACVLSAVCFGSLRHHDIYFHDDETFRDNRAISQDFSFFFSEDKEQKSGRPIAELVKWIAFSSVANNPGYCHLVVVGFHTLASVLLAAMFRLAGAERTTSFLAAFLFLTNVSHFQVVHHISALDFPLALSWATLSVICYLKYRSTSHPWWLIGCHGLAICAVLTHVAMASLGPFILVLESSAYNAGSRPRYSFGFGLAAVLAMVATAILWVTPASTTTGLSIANASVGELPELFAAFCRMLLWFLSRMLTTAHWLLLPVYEYNPWELVLGGIILASLLLYILSRNPLSPWGAWILLLLLPFALVSEAITLEGIEGPSHYLYMANAGASLLLSRALQITGCWLRDRWKHRGPVIYVGGLVALCYFSFVSLKQTEAFAFYNSGRYLRSVDVRKSIEYLERALAQGKDVLPTDDVYMRLVAILAYVGDDPKPLVREALKTYPNSVWAHSALGVLELESEAPEVRRRGRMRMQAARSQAEKSNKFQHFNRTAGSIYHNLASGYADRGMIRRAIAAYEHALEHDPNKTVTLNALSKVQVLLGIQLQQQNKIEESFSAYQSAVRRDPHNAEARINLAWVLYLRGNWDSAAAEYESLLEQGPYSHAMFNLALIYLARGQAEAAVSMYSRAVEEFGAAEGEEIGAVDDLLDLAKRGIQAENVQQLIETHWPLRLPQSMSEERTNDRRASSRGLAPFHTSPAIVALCPETRKECTAAS